MNKERKIIIYTVYKNINDEPLYFKNKENALKYINSVGLSYKWCPSKNSTIVIEKGDLYYLQDGTKIDIFET